MDSFFTPEMGLKAAQDALAGPECRIALVLPTSQPISEHIINSQTIWSVIGRSGQTGVRSAIEMLSDLTGATNAHPIIIHTDQLYQPADSTILALIEDTSIYLSPVECIVNDRYGYRLLVWTAAGLRALPVKSSLTDIVSLVIQHLRDCSLLGETWLERDQQIQRTVEHRRKTRRRQIRFLHSSVANAYMGEPANPIVATHLKRISDMVRALEQE